MKIDGKVTEGKLPVYECLAEGFHAAIQRVQQYAGFFNACIQEMNVLEDHLLRTMLFKESVRVASYSLVMAQMDAVGKQSIIVNRLTDLTDAIQGLVKVWEFGRQWHEPGAWKKVPADAFKSAFCRHLLERKSNPLDTESGLPHSYHMLFNALAVVYLENLVKE